MGGSRGVRILFADRRYQSNSVGAWPGPRDDSPPLEGLPGSVGRVFLHGVQTVSEGVCEIRLRPGERRIVCRAEFPRGLFTASRAPAKLIEVFEQHCNMRVSIVTISFNQ